MDALLHPLEAAFRLIGTGEGHMKGADLLALANGGASFLPSSLLRGDGHGDVGSAGPLHDQDGCGPLALRHHE